MLNFTHIIFSYRINKIYSILKHKASLLNTSCEFGTSRRQPNQICLTAINLPKNVTNRWSLFLASGRVLAYMSNSIDNLPRSRLK